MIRVTHIITDLDVGGAETTLLKLLSTCDRKRFEMSVISLTDVGVIGEQIAALGIPVRAMRMRPARFNPADLLRLTQAVSAFGPDVVQTWLYHSDLIGGIAARLAGAPVIWGIRSLMSDASRVKRGTLLVRRACALLSGVVPTRIVSCAVEAKRLHVEIGYSPGKMRVIPNGYDLEVFRPDTAARLSVREELGVENDVQLVGLVGRFDPQKDHLTFLQACAIVRERMPGVHFLLCGKGITYENEQIGKWLDEMGLRDSVHLLGPRSDVPRLVAALDVGALSSRSEAFPNVVAEAMACGVPCAVTDAGDASLIVGDTGRVVPPADPSALAEAIRELLEMDAYSRRSLGNAARKRIETEFSQAAATARYEALYSEIARSCVD